MPVRGLNGWMINQKLTFGSYETSRVKRGWDFSGSFQYTKFRIRPEEALLKVLHIDIDNKSLKQRNNFQYTIENGDAAAEVYATEKFSEKQLVYKSNNPYIGSVSKTKKYEYAFTAGIIPLTSKNNAPWSLVLINTYDINKDTNRKVFGQPYVEEEGYATNGEQSIAIRPLRVENVSTKDSRDVRVFGGKLLSGYELLIENEPIALIDILENSIWLHNKLNADDKLILSSIASAILLKRIQDVEKERTDL
ncbi:hypothetical protein SAE01_37040 [Segetibacter aerophilus]|uniref:Uncharacterized protein n=2 Tax=Segetibacter aerophilus TaxID=670293 RepID=A0A512BGW4_9BACT|nr:hypothetical protein SAE01_37040 [Segetibacter aerophilus]